MSRKARRIRFNRRDRRKAKASGYARSGTTNPKRVGHHVSSSVGVKSGATSGATRMRGPSGGVVLDHLALMRRLESGENMDLGKRNLKKAVKVRKPVTVHYMQALQLAIDALDVQILECGCGLECKRCRQESGARELICGMMHAPQYLKNIVKAAKFIEALGLDARPEVIAP